MAEKMIPPAKKRANNNNNNNNSSSSRGSTHTDTEMERSPANQDKSPPKKKKPPSTSSTLESAGFFEATTSGTSRDVSMLISKFAEVLSERAAADTSQMKELEVILTEAQNLESFLKEKKKRLRQTLALISDKLQG
ncbi:myosin-G heavy chain-like [Anoplopoma fimbria]|uniref:myosin-G heavy chain-like n=1 Tax=Anoplopoma fimbria TaxID=229290 RepID=UPI0023ED4664|nr:myosin-G heavy chain-like [Anoplopoma fimbria]XP_054460137.1 myosin-G heavy chain-like [Anoplopoma fimbria]XP_054460146.1 myosin-G heavy chain-like [Anoplopoma fimbria]XP_054460154.1 myosin-G heavy chain-like [Anoplopoma fimbria]